MQALEAAGKRIEYYALDLAEEELKRTLAQVPRFQHVTCHGLLGTFEDGREWLKQPKILNTPKCVLYMGSSIGTCWACHATKSPRTRYLTVISTRQL